MADDDKPPLRAELPISAEWSNVDLLRRTVIPYVVAAFEDDELSTRTSIITGELLENAVKYGNWETGDRRSFRLAVRGSERQLRVEVTNPVRDGAASLKKLIGLVEWIKRFPSPKDAYLTRLVEIANHEAAPGESGMGLVRLAYEAGCQIGVDLVDGGGAVVVAGTIERAVEKEQHTKDLVRMTTGDLPELEVEIVQPVGPEKPVQLRWSGRACHERPLSDFAPVVEAMIRKGCPGTHPVELNVVDLEDMSSTSAAVIMHAAQQLLEEGRDLTVIYDPQQKWQRLTFEGLRGGPSAQSLRFEAA